MYYEWEHTARTQIGFLIWPGIWLEKMIPEKYVHKRKLSAVRTDGEVFVVTVALGVPFKDDNWNSWACRVKAEGLFAGLATLRGINSWRAFRHSQSFVVSLLYDFLDQGGRLYTYDDNRELMKAEIDGFIRQAIAPAGQPVREIQPASAVCG